MNNLKVNEISLRSSRLAIIASCIALLALASLHTLSPEFDPAWRMVSEYANGNYGWMLSLMFAFWGIGAWALVVVLWSQFKTTGGRVGLFFLIAAGIGEVMAALFDINSQPLHDIAGYIGIFSLPVAAMLISVSLGLVPEWFAAKKLLLWTANLTWVSVVLLIATFAVMIGSFIQSGVEIDPQATITVLPPGVIGLVGWSNRFLIVVYCSWVITVAWQAIKIHKQSA